MSKHSIRSFPYSTVKRVQIHGAFSFQWSCLLARLSHSSWVRKGEGMSFQKSWTTSLLVLSSFPPRNLPPWSFLTSFSKRARWQKWTPLQKYLAILFKDFRIFLPAFHFFVVSSHSSANVFRVQIDLHFTKEQEILFKNFCSLAPVLSIFSAPVTL